MSLSIYSKASTDSLLALKANLSGATFTGAVTAPGLTITSGSGAVLTFADGTTQSTAATGGGGGATWGSITGSISAQTDLQTEFGNYLLLAGGTLTGGLTVASAGITFSDSSVQTTAATAFNGGTISNPLTIDSATSPQFYVTDSTHTTTPTLVVTDGTNATTITQNGVGAPGITVGSTGITFADSTTQTTAFTAGTFLPLSGGTMTGALQLGGDLNCDGYNLSSGNFSSPAGQVNCQNLTLTNGDGGSVTFADGSVQTTAASGGVDATSVANLSICATLFSWFYELNYYATPLQIFFNNGSNNTGGDYTASTFGGGFVSYVTSGQIGVWDGSNYCPFDGFQPFGVGGYFSQYFTVSTAASVSSYVLAYKDGSGTWHSSPFTLS